MVVLYPTDFSIVGHYAVCANGFEMYLDNGIVISARNG